MSERRPLEQNSLEENFELLEQTIAQLEEENIPLETAFRAYSDGMEILKVCNEQIDMVEKKVLKLNEQGELEEL
ncbi:MAG: exodeoxyribonuclease VII small subunit [Lachnospiraceae bacterium]|nr:exodeoxyribonuclease VII small subunit [Lachnospiraceae bacterium]